MRGAIIGFGGIAKLHTAAYKHIQEVSIVAVADVTAAQLASAGEEFGINDNHLYADYKRMLERESPDFVDVCVPHRYHREIVTAAAERGIHIVCEKPIAMSMAEADAMIAVADSNNVHFVVCHNWCYHPVFSTLKTVIDGGVVGKVLFQQFDVFQKSGVWQGSARQYLPHWRTMVNLSGGGALMDTGFHFCYLSSWLTENAWPRSVTAAVDTLRQTSYSVEDYAQGIFRYENGCLFDLSVGWFTTGKSLHSLIEGTTGALVIPSPFSCTYASDPILVQREKKVETIPVRRQTGRGEASWADDFSYSYTALMRDAVALIGGDQGVRNPIRAQDGRSTLEMVLASYESAALGQCIQLPLHSDGPVYQKGVLGLGELDIPRNSSVYMKNIFGVRS